VCAYNHKTDTRTVFTGRIESLTPPPSRAGAYVFLLAGWALAARIVFYVYEQDRKLAYGFTNGSDNTIDYFTPLATLAVAAVAAIAPMVIVMRLSGRHEKLAADVKQRITEVFNRAIEQAGNSVARAARAVSDGTST